MTLQNACECTCLDTISLEPFLCIGFTPASLLLDPRSQRAGSYKIGAVIVNV